MAGLKIYVRRQGSILVPASAEAEEAIRSLPLDTVLRADVVRVHWRFSHTFLA